MATGVYHVWASSGDSQALQPVDAEVTVLLRVPEEPAALPTGHGSNRLDAYIQQAQTLQPVPEPIQLRGVGRATL